MLASMSISTGPTDQPPLSLEEAEINEPGGHSGIRGDTYDESSQESLALSCSDYPAFRRILGPNHHSSKANGIRHPRRRIAPRQRNRHQKQEWEEAGQEDTIAIIEPPNGNNAIVTSGRRTPRLLRQEAFRAASTSLDWRSLDYVNDDEELYRMGILYDESATQSRSSSRATSLSRKSIEEPHSANFNLQAISHREPMYSIRVSSGNHHQQKKQKRMRQVRIKDREEDVSDNSQEDEYYRHNNNKNAMLPPPHLDLDLSFTAFTTTMTHAWPRHGCQDTRGLVADELPATIARDHGYVKHIIYELHEDAEEMPELRCPGTPITQTPDLMEDDDSVSDGDAEWFSLMEDGWSPITNDDEEMMDLDSSIESKSALSDSSRSATWVVLGRDGA